MKTSKASSMLPIGARVAVKYLKVVDIRIECHSLCFISFLHVNTAAAAVYWLTCLAAAGLTVVSCFLTALFFYFGF